MRPHDDLDQGVARPRSAARALALEPQGPAVRSPLGDGDIEGAPIRERDAPLAACDRFLKVDVHPRPDIGPTGGEAAAPAAASAATAEHVAQNVVEIDAIKAPGLETALSLFERTPSAKTPRPGVGGRLDSTTV